MITLKNICIWIGDWGSITIELDKTYKVQDYNYSISGKIEKSKFELSESIKNNFITEEIKEIYLSDLQIKTIFETKNISLNGEGKYSFNNMDFLKINLENKFKDDLLNLKLDFEYGNSLVLDLINYKKPKNSIANLSFDLKKNKDNIKIEKLYYKEGNNLIKINNLGLKKISFYHLKK